MAGYWNEPPLAARRVVRHRRSRRTRRAGCLRVHARRADLIVTGGENAYPAEVERALEAFPGIAAAGVFGVPDEVWGQTVAAALVAERHPPPTRTLVRIPRPQLAPHKRPRHVCYVPRLPQTPAGKLTAAPALPGDWSARCRAFSYVASSASIGASSRSSAMLRAGGTGSSAATMRFHAATLAFSA